MALIYKELIEFSQRNINFDNSDKYYNDCWQNIPKWIDTIKKDLENIFKQKVFARSAEIYFNDPFFKQSATAIVFCFAFYKETQFSLRCECLVDHSSILIKVKNRPTENTNLIKIADRIETSYNNNYEVQLKELENIDIEDVVK